MTIDVHPKATIYYKLETLLVKNSLSCVACCPCLLVPIMILNQTGVSLTVVLWLDKNEDTIDIGLAHFFENFLL